MKPNVLILLSDQQRHDTIHACGYDYMITPNLDKLAQEGCQYRNAYSSNPVCMPARHDLITGMHARAHGFYANKEVSCIKDYGIPTLPRIFTQNGYRTAAIGKMHFTPTREHHGFSEMHLMEELPKRVQDDAYATYLKDKKVQNLHGVRPYLYHTPQKAVVEEQDHGTSFVAQRSIEWLENNADEPFFLMCGFIAPHPPWNNPTELDGLYAEQEIPMPLPLSRSKTDVTEPTEWFGDFDTDEQKRKTREAYYTAISLVDKNVGKIIEYLRESGKLDNTLVIYTSDHGEMLYDKGYFSKELGYEGACHIPFLVRYPEKLAPACTEDKFVSLVDILPTCLDVCGLPYPKEVADLAGQSVFTEKNVQADAPDYAFAASGEGRRRFVMVRNHTYKYIYNYNGGIEEFYDMCTPDGETVDMIDTAPKDVYEELRAQAIQFEAKNGPEYCIEDGAFVSIVFECFPPEMRGKYHFWSNMQMQRFFKENRGETLLNEMKVAVDGQTESLFMDETWFENFARYFEIYTGSALTKETFLANFQEFYAE